MQKEHIKSELKSLTRAEEKFINKNITVKESKLQETISRYVPDKLENTLNKAFYKAFSIVFENGTDFIEKTYNKEKYEQDFKVNEYSADLRNNKSSLKKFDRVALGSKTINMAISAAEGVGMGILGLGIPDIPIFISVILKSIYEIALHFGYSYETEKERIFILQIIETALCHEDNLVQGDIEINDWINSDEKLSFFTSMDEQMKKTSLVLSKELLYLKFVQGIPVAGVIGGVSDIVYQKKITDYALLKYKRRFLIKHMKEDVII